MAKTLFDKWCHLQNKSLDSLMAFNRSLGEKAEQQLQRYTQKNQTKTGQKILAGKIKIIKKINDNAIEKSRQSLDDLVDKLDDISRRLNQKKDE